MSRTVLARAIGSLALAFALAGCATRQSIADIKYNPGRYQDRTVAVEGVVTSSWGVPLVPFKLYKVDDGTGEMTVVANNGRTPTKGVAGPRQGTRQRRGDVRRPVARPAPRAEGHRFQATLSLRRRRFRSAATARDPNDDSGHVVVRRRLAAPFRDGREDRVDDRPSRADRARRSTTSSSRSRRELLAVARSSPRTRRPCRTRTRRRRAARTTPRRRSSPGTSRAARPAARSGAQPSAEQRIGYGRPELASVMVRRFRSKIV